MPWHPRRRQWGVRRLIFLSSVTVNGESTSLDCPFTEHDAPAPIGPYGQSELEAEVEFAEIAV